MTPEQVNRLAKLNLKANFAARIQGVLFPTATLLVVVAVALPSTAARAAALVCVSVMEAGGFAALMVWRKATMEVLHISYDILEQLNRGTMGN